MIDPLAKPALRTHTPAFVSASVVWHAGAAVFAALQPALWPWALGAVVLNHLALTAIGLWPRSSWLGRNVRRLPDASAAQREVAITIDDGPDPEVTPAVLDILDAHGARATFFCIASRAQAQPALTREIVARGHSVQNHSQRHVHTFSLLGRAGFIREIGAAQRALADITGIEPRFFRAPAGLRNPLLDGVLQQLGLTLVSWTRRGFDTRRGNPTRVLAALTKNLRAGDIVLLHDGHAARTADGRAVVLEVLPALLARLYAEGLTPVTLPHAMARLPSAADRAAWQALCDAASEPYRRAGRFAWHFARGKLRFDPVFAHVMQRGLIRAGERVLDLGCGQGLVASLVESANQGAMAMTWPSSWPAPPHAARVTGIDIAACEIARAQTALGPSATFHCADMRTTPLPASDVVLLLDALHYIERDEQLALLTRVRSALTPGGRLVMRVGDGAAHRRHGFARAVDHLVAIARRGRVVPQATRPVTEWQAVLDALGFSVETCAMDHGTPFANVLLVATCGAQVSAPASVIAHADASTFAGASALSGEATPTPTPTPTQSQSQTQTQTQTQTPSPSQTPNNPTP